MSLKKNYYFWMFVLFFLVVLATFLINIGIGSVEIPVKDVVKILTDGLIDGDTNSSIVWKIRLPRAIAVIFGGASIAVSGLIMQIFFRNPIVEPFVLGVSSGATLMVGLVILGGAVLGIPPIFLNSWTTVGAAFFGSLLVMAINLIVASRVKSNVSLLVVGLMIGYVCSALTNMLVTFAEEAQVKGFVVWQMGSFSGFTWNSVKTLVIISIPLLLLSTLMHKPLNAMVLGERYATSLGINIRLVKVFLIGVSSLLSASVTAFAGPVGFIGLAVPHGICDCIARMLFSPTEIALGSVTSLIGAPLVAYLILRRNKDNG